MKDSDILEACKTPFPLLDDWVKKECKKAFADQRRAMITFVFVRETIQSLNETKIYRLLPDDCKKSVVQILTVNLINSKLINTAWEKIK